MNKQEIHFSDLDLFTSEISSGENFETITAWMENRFVGLPLFHQSVKLRVKRFEKVIEGNCTKLEPPSTIIKMAAPHLKNNFNGLLHRINQNEGVKTFGLLYLSVGLIPQLLNKEFSRYENRRRCIPAIVKKLSTLIEVPIVLAVASRKTDIYYESLAVGLKGVSTYCSYLSLSNPNNLQKYIVNAGLEASVSLEHLDHMLCRASSIMKCRLIPDGFLNRYLKNHLIPEREDIVKKLCDYVFNGCNLPNSVLPDSNSPYYRGPSPLSKQQLNVY